MASSVIIVSSAKTHAQHSLHPTLALIASAKVKSLQMVFWFVVVSALARASAGKANR